MPQTQPLILTLKLDNLTFGLFDDLRQAHFPASRNIVPAHVTLFHALPGEQEPAIRRDLAEVTAAYHTLSLSFADVQFLGRGVAIKLQAPELLDLRHQLADRWQQWLSAQDEQPYRPHITIQNKVAPETARRLFVELDRNWKSLEGTGEGLVLWRYLAGPWEHVAEFLFIGSRDAPGEAI